MPTRPPTFETLAGHRQRAEAARNSRRRDRIALYSSAAWQRLRAVVLAEQPVCAACGVAPSAHVDHIIDLAERPDLALARENLQGLCPPCHSAKTAGACRGDRRDPPLAAAGAVPEARLVQPQETR